MPNANATTKDFRKQGHDKRAVTTHPYPLRYIRNCIGISPPEGHIVFRCDRVLLQRYFSKYLNEITLLNRHTGVKPKALSCQPKSLSSISFGRTHMCLHGKKLLFINPKVNQPYRKHRCILTPETSKKKRSTLERAHYSPVCSFKVK